MRCKKVFKTFRTVKHKHNSIDKRRVPLILTSFLIFTFKQAYNIHSWSYYGQQRMTDVNFNAAALDSNTKRILSNWARDILG
jgi:hypothetical protein